MLNWYNSEKPKGRSSKSKERAKRRVWRARSKKEGKRRAWEPPQKEGSSAAMAPTIMVLIIFRKFKFSAPIFGRGAMPAPGGLEL